MADPQTDKRIASLIGVAVAKRVLKHMDLVLENGFAMKCKVEGDGATFKADDDGYPSLVAKLSFRDVTLQAGFVSREKGIPTASYGTFFPTDRTQSLDEHFYTSLKYEHQFEHQINFPKKLRLNENPGCFPIF